MGSVVIPLVKGWSDYLAWFFLVSAKKLAIFLILLTVLQVTQISTLQNKALVAPCQGSSLVMQKGHRR